MLPTAVRPKRLGALLSGLAIAVALPGCAGSPADENSGGSTSTATSSTASATATAPAASHNAADISFAAHMIPHHQQALTLSELVPDRTDNSQVIVLAAEIKTAQRPEIEELQAMLAQWGAPAATADHTDMAGMVDEDTVTKLESLRGHEFDTLWLESMISHHEGAMATANTEMAKGANAAAKTLAAKVITTQQDEIDRMAKLVVD